MRYKIWRSNVGPQISAYVLIVADPPEGPETNWQRVPEAIRRLGFWSGVKAHRVDALTSCKPHIERLAENDFEWTGWTTFQQYQWRQKPNVVTFLGDEIKYQNGLGAWIRHSYECDFDVA